MSKQQAFVFDLLDHKKQKAVVYSLVERILTNPESNCHLLGHFINSDI